MKDTIMGNTQVPSPQPVVDELFASRPGMGTRGANSRFTAKVNCLQITTWPKSFFFQYSVLRAHFSYYQEVTPWHSDPEKQARAKRVPRAIAKRVVANLMATNAELQPRGSYDGVDQLWMPKKIKRDTLVFLHKEPGNGEDFRVELKYRSSVSTDILKQLVTMELPSGLTERRSPAAALVQLATPLLVVQSIIQMASRVQWLDKAGKFVVLTEPFKDIELPGLQLFKGLYSSVKPTIGRLLVNVDVTSLLVYQSGPLLNVAASSLGPSLRYGDVRNMGREHIQRLRSFLTGVSIILTYDPRGKVKKIADVRPAGGTFLDEEGRTVSVVDFFATSRKIPIRYPNLPCITYRAKLRDGSSRNCEVPMELCEVLPNQVFKRSAPGEVMQKISKSRAAEKNAAARLLKIEGDRRSENPSAYDQLKLGDSDFIRSTGMVVDNQLIEIKGRRLEPPQIHFSNHTEQIDPTRGTRFNLVGKRFLEPAQPRRIALIRFWAPRREDEQRDRRNSEGLKDDLIERMVKLGMLPWSARGGQRPEYDFVEDDARLIGHIGRVLDKVRSRFGGRNPDLVFALVPSIADEVVHHLKHCGDLVLRDAAHCGFATQVMQFAKLPPRGKRDAYLNNVLAKVNPRLGGVNWKLSGKVWPWYDKASDSLAGCMIIGADVSHGAAGNVNYPSVAGVVSTVDHTYARFIGSSAVQAGGRGGESIFSLDRIVAEHLMTWARNHKGDWPDRIVYYRDGVAESQLEQVTSSEITAIRNAYRRAQKHAGVETTADFVEITMIYAVKRHHVRMFPKDMRDRDRMGNCYAGSVFDEGIAHPTLFDFYLQSHTALQGTARPTRYIVALNQSRYTVNELQQLTYDLCFLYARATQSVSIPAPVYYADLLCGRHKYGFEYEYDFNAAPEDPFAAAQYHAAHFTHEVHPVHRNPVKMYFI